MIECQRSLVGARLLDVGCATGQLLKKAMIRGALSTGIDISPQAVDEARHHGLEARVGTIESEDRNGCYDIVTAFEVIEHVENPVSFLKNAYRNLSPGGLMAITTPNYANSFIHGEKWIGFQMSMEHLYYFSDEV
ncbi:MAG: class I SAM-dependent methyltransferase, partial [Gaiellaceae bacterium]